MTNIDFNYRGSGKTAAQYFADEAVRHANRAVKFSRIALWLIILGFVLQAVSLILRLMS